MCIYYQNQKGQSYRVEVGVRWMNTREIKAAYRIGWTVMV